MSDLQNKPPVESKRTRLIPELRATLKQINLTPEVSRGKSAEFSTDTILQSETLTREFLSNIAIIAFVGQSGTGKSTRAIAVARQNNIDYLIDDGLLINGGRIVAGTSAKKAPSKMESVRQALFVDPTRSQVMRRAIVESNPTAIMILGTSDSMLEKITTNLWLNKPSLKAIIGVILLIFLVDNITPKKESKTIITGGINVATVLKDTVYGKPC